mgnify:CR=1 FL=1
MGRRPPGETRPERISATASLLPRVPGHQDRRHFVVPFRHVDSAAAVHDEDHAVVERCGVSDQFVLTFGQRESAVGVLLLGLGAEAYAENHGVGRADDAPLDGIGSHRHEPVGPADQLLDMRAAAHGLRIERVHAPYVGHRDVSRKPRHLARHLAFEAHDDGHREDHHRHPQRHRHHGDTLHHPGLVPGRGLRHAACDEKGEIHGSCFAENLCKVTYKFRISGVVTTLL